MSIIDKSEHPAAQRIDPVMESVLICLRKIIQSYYVYSRFLYRKVGLTGPQMAVLRQIQQHGRRSVGEIAKSISLSQATVTGILERLEKRGLVTRNRSRSDRRKVYVDPTDAGIRLLAASPPIAQESFLKGFDQLQDWEKSMILAALQRLAQLMDGESSGIISHPFGDRIDSKIDHHGSR